MGAEVGVRPPAARRRLHRRHWLTPAVLAAIVLVIAVTGGFRAAPPVGEKPQRRPLRAFAAKIGVR